jgi:hypothetical protein
MRRFKTWFDSTLSRRGALAFWAVMAILGLVIIGTLLLLGLNLVPVSDPAIRELPVTVRVFLTAMSRSLGIPAPETVLAGVLTLWFWFIGLLVMGTIFAWRTSALNRTTTRVLAGRTPITNRGHTVILGWSPIVPVLVRELARSTSRTTQRTVVLLSALDRRVTMDALEDILQGDASAARLRLITRSGDPWNPNDLRRVNCGAATTVIIVDDVAKSEYSSMTLAFAASAQREDDRQICIVQVRNLAMKAIVDRATDAHYISVTSEDVILKALAQSARQPGVTETLFELLDFDGAEVHRQHVDGSVGLTYTEVVRRLEGGSAIGIVRQDGSTLVNPPVGTTVREGEDLLLVKESSDDIATLGPVEGDSSAVAIHVRLDRVVEPHVAIVGPAGPALRVAHNLRSFLSGTATISILSRDPVDVTESVEGGTLIHAHVVSDYFESLAERMEDVGPDQVVVLADTTPGTSAAETDAKTGVIVAAARQALAASLKDVRFVAQVLDPASRTLIPTRASDDLIVSEEASAMMIAQAASDPVVFKLLVDLLDPSLGSAIHVLSLVDERADGPALLYRDLVDVGLRSGVSVIGWCHLGTGAGLKVNVTVGRDTPVPDAAGFGVLAIAGSTKH